MIGVNIAVLDPTPQVLQFKARSSLSWAGYCQRLLCLLQGRKGIFPQALV